MQLEVHNSYQSQTISDLGLWTTYSFAPNWLADAKSEACKVDTGPDARRREIVFSVAFAESYLVEWVRDEILQRNFEKFSKIFPTAAKLPAIKKWKDIPKKLTDEGLLKGMPDLNSSFWQEWCTLVSYRDGLIHAVCSRPSGTSIAEEEAPLPSIDKLAKLEPGWALHVAINLIKNFHVAAGTNAPQWLCLDARIK